MLNMPELLHNKSAVSIHDGAFPNKQRKGAGSYTQRAKNIQSTPGKPCGCNIRYLSCVVYTIPYFRILCKFLPNVLGILFFLFLDFCRTGLWRIRCSGMPPVWQLFFIVAGMSILEALFALIFLDIFVLNFLALSLIYSEIWRFSASDIFEKSLSRTISPHVLT